VRVDDTMVERTILRIAEENKMAPDQFRKALERENIQYGPCIARKCASR